MKITSSVSGGGPGSDTTAARVSDPRFYGIERVDLKARYGAPLDGTLHPLSTMGLAAAQSLYPNIGLTGSTALSSYAQDTAAILQAEYDLRVGSGGIIGIADAGTMMASQTLWLQQGGKVHLHGGRNTRILGEACGTAPVLRASNTSGNVGGAATGSAQAIPFRDLTLFAWNAGRAYFGSAAGTANPGYANSAAMAGNPGGYRAGSCAIQIDDGGAAGLSSGLSGPASVYTTVENVRWFNFDDSLRWGDDTFAITLLHCMAENNNKGFSWAQTTTLNSFERIVIRGGTYSNNNFGLHAASTWTDSGGTHSQGGSLFIHNASIDYNSVSQGTFLMAANGDSYPQAGVHTSDCHIENRAEVIGSAPWFTLQGVGMWSDNEFYINTLNSVATTGLVAIGDNSSGSMVNNRIGGACPLFVSSTSNAKMVHGHGNTQQPVGSNLILLSDSAGIVMQSRPPSTDPTVAPYTGDFAYSPIDHGHVTDIFISGSLATFTMPPESASFRPGHLVNVWNTTASDVQVRTHGGSQVVGCYGSDSPSSDFGTNVKIKANSGARLRRANYSGGNYWTFIGGFTDLPS